MKKFLAFLLAVAAMVAIGVGAANNITARSGGSGRLPLFEDIRNRIEVYLPRGGEPVPAPTGKIVEVRRQLPAFSRVELNGSGQVVVALADDPGVLVAADESIVSQVVTEVRGEVLYLGVRPGVRVSDGAVRYTVSADMLESVKTTGSGDIRVEGVLKTKDLDLISEGSGKIDVQVDVEDLEVRIAGSGDVSISGEAEDLEVAILGSGNVRAAELGGDEVSVNVAGSGDVDLGLFKSVEANIAGSGDVTYEGSPQISTKIFGSGKIRGR
jgi:hypothetical protein